MLLVRPQSAPALEGLNFSFCCVVCFRQHRRGPFSAAATAISASVSSMRRLTRRNSTIE